MYEHLVKRLRHFPEEYVAYKMDADFARTVREAADAIEGLIREAEEYKAAYREEHNKRIAENRYLYDELTKTVRAKRLMTPMRIEVPEQPEEE